MWREVRSLGIMKTLDPMHGLETKIKMRKVFRDAAK
jgi:hypothetical protein